MQPILPQNAESNSDCAQGNKAEKAEFEHEFEFDSRTRTILGLATGERRRDACSAVSIEPTNRHPDQETASPLPIVLKSNSVPFSDE